MRRACLVACLGLCAVATSFRLEAGDASSYRDRDLFIRPEDQFTVVFGSLDAGRSVFVNGGAKQTLTGPLDRDGFATLEATGFGLTRERVRSDDHVFAIDRFTHMGSAMLGYQWALDGLYVAAFGGPEVYQQQVTYDGTLRRLSQPRIGGRTQIELWATPTPDTLLTTSIVAGTARLNTWARQSAGIRVAPDVYVGPEVTVYATPSYTETRWGGHITGLSAGIVQMRVSAGWMTDDAHRRGSPYAGLSAWIRL